MHYQKLDHGRVGCLLCPHHCQLNPGQKGFCLNRRNQEGTLYTLNYGGVAAMHLDPIEKKPLYHFYPGEQILSFGTFGCSLNCRFCQNSSLARSTSGEDSNLLPEECVELAKKYNSFAIAYTYNEPFIWFEHVLETAKLAKDQGIKNVLVTNGYYETEPWEQLAPFIDAMNIDLKGNEAFYARVCKGELMPVLKTIKSAFKRGIHVEIAHLVVTGENDRMEDFQEIIREIESISPRIPLHISRYFPNYELSNAPTNPQILEDFYQRAKETLEFVYLGNLITETGQHTLCPRCGARLIERTGYQTVVHRELKQGKCPDCGHLLYGVFK